MVCEAYVLLWMLVCKFTVFVSDPPFKRKARNK